MTITVNVPLRFRVRRRTAANWTSGNEVLLSAEIGLETDTNRFKFGDGVTAWNSLGYFTAANLPIADAGGYFTGTDVEAALQEIGLALATPGGAGDAVSFDVAQVAHGFIVGNAVANTAAGWVKADRDADSTVGDGIVSAVADADNFTITRVGLVTLTTAEWDAVTGGSGGLVKEFYWLGSTAGGTSATKPTPGIAQVMFKGFNSTTAIVMPGEAVESVTMDADLVTIAGLSPSNDDFLQRKAGAWANRTVAQVKTDLGLVGTNTGDQTSVTGNAGTATALQTARTIDGVSFDGTANITVIAPATVAASSKATPVDADVMPIADSAAANVLKKLTWANLKATLWTSWGALIAGGTDKATPVDADMLPIADSAASNATKKLTLANLIAYIKAALGWAEGTYTPTLTNTTNIAASTAFACQYLRQGNTVTVSGRVNIDPTAGSVATLLGMSLPIASNFASVFQAGGTAVCTDVASLSAGIIADTVNDRVSFSWVHTADASNRAWSFSFTYRVI